MRIGICDGEETWRVKIENLLSVYSRQEKIDLTVIGFSGVFRQVFFPKIGKKNSQS